MYALNAEKSFPSKALFVDYTNLPDAVPEFVFPEHFGMAKELDEVCYVCIFILDIYLVYIYVICVIYVLHVLCTFVCAMCFMCLCDLYIVYLRLWFILMLFIVLSECLASLYVL